MTIKKFQTLDLKINAKEKIIPKNENPIKLLLVSTGGTIASKIDYRTGAVTPVLSPKDLLSSVPELASIADIDVKTILSEHSENIIPEQWVKMAIYFDSLATSKYAGIIVYNAAYCIVSALLFGKFLLCIFFNFTFYYSISGF